MATKHSSTYTIYEQVLDTTREYLGPAAERFVTRQIETHLNKQPEELNRADLVKLSDWIKLAITLLTDDQKVVNKYLDSLSSIANDKA